MSEILEALKAEARRRRPNLQQDRASFYLTGRTADTQLADVAGLGLRAAPLAAYRRPEELRHDYPLILLADPEAPLRPLSGLIDDLLEARATGEDADRVRQLGLVLEQHLRARAEQQVVRLSEAWSQAVATMTAEDPTCAPHLERLTAARDVDGELVACTTDSARRIVTHVWSVVQAARVQRLAARLERLRHGLADILAAEQANSAAGLTPDRIAHSIGPVFAGELDVTALARLLTDNRPAFLLGDARRERVRRLLEVLESQQFVPPAGREGYEFVYDAPAAAIAAYHERFTATTELAKALVIAELEIDGRYREQAHDALFESWSVADLDAATLEMFPEYLVHCDLEQLSPADTIELLEALSDHLPINAVVCVNDLVPHAMAGGAGGLSPRTLTGAALGDGEAFILQVPASALAVAMDQLVRGCAAPRSALFAVYTGAGQWVADLPPFIAAAAATEARVFPAYCYDPSAGPTWADRFTLHVNPRVDEDWPVRPLRYADESLQHREVELAFTAADFFAGDARFLHHLALAGDDFGGTVVPFAEHLAKGSDAWTDELPYLLMVDAEDGLHRVLVDRPLLRLVGHILGKWRRLQERGGIHNSYAARELAHERAQWEAERAELIAAAKAASLGLTSGTGQAGPATGAPAAAPAVADLLDLGEEEDEPVARDPYQPWIETARCSTCNECTLVNDRMFAYNENRQAYIADADAGTFAELVQAAENCQVAIIHPGKPRNPAEPGLEDLIKRAEPFT